VSKLRLTIELVPQSCWFSNVRAVVSQSQWDRLRIQVYKQANYICQICGGVGPKHPVECHEIWHYDDKKLIQTLEGMIALCPNCHMVKHIGLAEIQNKSEQALQHFMKVNGLKKKEAKQHINAAFTKWSERSAKLWKLDISLLERYGIDVEKIKKS
jgi:hypothetical protein